MARQLSFGIKTQQNFRKRSHPDIGISTTSRIRVWTIYDFAMGIHGVDTVSAIHDWSISGERAGDCCTFCEQSRVCLSSVGYWVSGVRSQDSCTLVMRKERMKAYDSPKALTHEMCCVFCLPLEGYLCKSSWTGLSQTAMSSHVSHKRDSWATTFCCGKSCFVEKT